MQTDDIALSDPRLVKKGPDWGHRRGRPVKAARYALRVSRGVVVSSNLSRWNAASYSDSIQGVLESDQHPHDSDDECRQQVGNAHVRQAEEVRTDTENQDIADGAEAL